jgi:signal transduction histidine kinase
MYKERIREMESRISALERVIKLVQVINSKLELSPLLDTIVEVATQLTDTESASVMLIDKDTGELHFVAVSSQVSANIKPVPVPMDGSIAGTVAKERKPLLIRDAQSDPRWYQTVDQASGFVTRSIIAVPMTLHGEVIGVVEAVNKRYGEEMSWDDVETLAKLAAQAAIAVHNARLVTELQQAYDELNELDRLKSDFISIAAHELRTPLSLILGYVSFLREDASGRAREQVEVVLQSAMRLKSLIDDMVNLQEVDSGEAALHLEHLAVQELVRAGIAEVEYIAEAKEQNISVSMPQQPIVVEADRSKLTLAMVNLLSNAVKFTDRGKRIGVRAQRKDGTAQITVWDTGVGIPQDQIDRIFDRFYQVETSLVRRFEGMGLGLSIVREMVELHHGRVEVQSQPGKGSAFTVIVPLSQPAQQGTQSAR